MLAILKKLFGAKEQSHVSHIKFRDSIKALAMEIYKDTTIVYLSKPSVKKENCPSCKDMPEGEVKEGHDHQGNEQLIYHAFYKKQFYFGEATSMDELEYLAHCDVDTNFESQRKDRN